MTASIKRLQEAARVAQETGDYKELAKVYNADLMAMIERLIIKHTANFFELMESMARSERDEK